MPRSLLDAADIGVVRDAAAARGGPAAVTVACLLDGGVLTFYPDEPNWPDRDRLVVGSALFSHALDDVGDGPPFVSVPGGRALAVAAGLALSSALDGGVSRVYCLLDGGAMTEGVVWEAAMAGADAPLTVVALVDDGTLHGTQQVVAQRAGALFEAAGWRVATAPAGEPLEVLGAIDRMCGYGQGGAGVVLALCA